MERERSDKRFSANIILNWFYWSHGRCVVVLKSQLLSPQCITNFTFADGWTSVYLVS